MKFIPTVFYCMLFLGGVVSILNFYTSFLRYPLHKLKGGTRENFKYISGFPIVGNIINLIALIGLLKVAWAVVCIILFLVIDTGGIGWFIASQTIIKKKENNS